MILLQYLSRSLHRQLVSIVVVLFIILTVVMVWVMETNLSSQLQRVEAQFVQRDMERLVDLLEDKSHELDSAITVWSNWDDAWLFMADQAPNFVHRNFATNTLLKSNIEFMTFWTPTGQLKYGAYEHPSVETHGKLPLWVTETLGPHWPEWAKLMTSKQNRHGILLTKSGVLILTAQPIVRTNGQGPSRGMIIAGYRLDSHDRRDLIKIVHSDFTLTSLPQNDPIAQTESTVITRINESTLTAQRHIHDIHQVKTMRVLLTQPRTIYQEGKRNLHLMLIIVTILAIALLLAAFGLVDYRIVRRIRALSNAVKSVSMGGSPALLPVAKGVDEIDSLQREVKVLFENQMAYQKELLDARIQAEDANLAKRQFLARVSHEIRTPLNGIIGTTTLLETTNMNDEQQEYLSMIQSSSGLLLELVNDTLDFSKIESGKVSLEHIPFNLEKELKELIHIIHPKIVEKHLSFYVYLHPDTPRHLVGDPYRLRQILVNLLSNASKFTQTGHILLSVDYINLTEGDHRPFFNFVVEDTGMGIPQERQNQIFKEFEQADSTISRNFGGSGLGLAICKQLAEMMDSELGVESQPGRGSRFWLHAHLQLDADQPVPAPLPEERPLTVVVLPTSIAQSIFCRYLNHWGFPSVHLDSLEALAEWAKTVDPAQSTLLMCDGQWLQDETRRSQLESLYTQYFNHQPWVILTKSNQKRVNVPGDAHWLLRPVLPSALYQLLHSVLRPTLALEADPSRAFNPDHPPETPVPLGHILIVEDNAINQKVLERMLTKAGYTASIASDGVQAMAVLAEASFDLILMDCHMPEMDGFEATVKIRASQAPYANIPIVAVTGNAIESELQKCLASGMNDTLTKPIHKDALFAKITAYINITQ